MWAEIKRKLFHLIGLLYVVGLVFIPRTRYIVVLTVAVVVIFLVEQGRLRFPAVRHWFEKSAGDLFRDHERAKMSGVFWMAEGVWVTVVLLKSVPLATATLLYLLLGDTVASLVGKRIQGPRWGRSQKSISGSAACFAMCLIVGDMVLRPNYYGWNAVVLGAVVATVVEALPLKWNDNFTIPAATSVVFMVFFS